MQATYFNYMLRILANQPLTNFKNVIDKMLDMMSSNLNTSNQNLQDIQPQNVNRVQRVKDCNCTGTSDTEKMGLRGKKYGHRPVLKMTGIRRRNAT
jgi:hypothetical protein